MKIYLDYIFLENLIVNAVIIFQTIKCIDLKIKLKKKIIWTIIDAIVACYIYIKQDINPYIINILFTSFMIVVILKPKNIISYIKYTCIYYYVYILYIGLIIFSTIIFNIHLEIYINKLMLYFFAGIISKYIIDKMCIMWKNKTLKSDLLYSLKIQNKEITVFLDTGNKVYDYLNKASVIFIDNSIKDEFALNNYEKVEFEINTVSGIDVKEGYIIKNVIITKDNEEYVIDKVIICFSNIHNTPEKYSGIIGYELYLRNLNGGV